MRLRTTLTAALAVALLAPAAAQAAPPSPWKIVKRTNLAGSEQFTQIAAGGPKSVWAFGLRTGSKKGQLLSYHFDGRKWRSAPFPKGVKTNFNPESEYYGGGTLTASTPSNAWTFFDGDYRYPAMPELPNECEPGGYRTPAAKARAGRVASARARSALDGVTAKGDNPVIKKPAKVLRWSGGRWKVVKALKDVIPWMIKARGAKEALIFGDNVRTGRQVMLRFDGKKWRSTNTPIVMDATVEGKNVWVSSYDKKGTPEIYRWSGGGWTSVRYGRALPAEVIPTKDRDGVSSSIASFSARKGKLTVLAETWRGPLCATAANRGTLETSLVTGVNGSWRPVSLQGLKGWNLRAHWPDGRGGGYLSVDNFPLYFEELPPEWTPDIALFHKTASGSWRRVVLPKKVVSTDAIVTTPGSRVLWMAGAVQGQWDTDGVILRSN
ncbi:hypothetical protein GCM10027589_21990 [Actinocorallia lasiicapitis]